MDPTTLDLVSGCPVEALNAGLFVSPGQGVHATRTLDSYELLLVRTGRISMFEDDRRFDVRAGQALILRPGRTHGGFGPYEPELSFYWVHFRIRTRRPGSPVGRLSVPQLTTLQEPERVYELFHRFIDDQETDSLTPLAASLIVMLMLAELAHAARADGHAPRDGGDLAGRVDQFISRNFHVPLGTAAVAGALHYNPDYLGRVYRKVKGHSITDALNRCRVKEARALLRQNSVTVREVARACGFKDVGYFRIVFKRYSGVTPGAFRHLYSHLHINTH